MIVVYCADRLTDRRCNAVAQLPATIPCNFGLGIPTEAWDTRARAPPLWIAALRKLLSAQKESASFLHQERMYNVARKYLSHFSNLLSLSLSFLPTIRKVNDIFISYTFDFHEILNFTYYTFTELLLLFNNDYYLF